MPSVEIFHSGRTIWRKEIGPGLGETLGAAIKDGIPNVKFHNFGSQDVPGGERWGYNKGFSDASGRELYFVKFYIGSLLSVYLIDGDPTEQLERILPELKQLKKVKKVMEA